MSSGARRAVTVAVAALLAGVLAFVAYAALSPSRITDPAEVTAAFRAAMAKVSSKSSGVVLVKSVTSLDAYGPCSVTVVSSRAKPLATRKGSQGVRPSFSATHAPNLPVAPIVSRSLTPG